MTNKLIIGVLILSMILLVGCNNQEPCKVTMEYGEYNLLLFGDVTPVIGEDSTKECCCVNIQNQHVCVCDEYKNITGVNR